MCVCVCVVYLRSFSYLCPGHSYHKYRRGRKERKLHHLRRITHMVKGRELRDITPEEEAEETPYFADWEGRTSHTNLLLLLSFVLLSVNVFIL